MPTLARLAPLLSVAIALALVSSAPAGAASVRDWSRTFQVPARPSVQVRTQDGRVRVHPGAAGVVKAEVHWRSRHWGFTSPSREPAVRIEQTATGVDVLVQEPAVFAVFGAVSEELRVDVTVPEECDLTVRTGDGAIVLDAPLRGTFDLTSGDGRVILRGTRGSIRVATGDGAIEATDVDGRLAAHASDGRVHLDGRFDDLDVSAHDGTVDVTARAGSRLATGWELQTRDGGLELLIPRDLEAELDVRTGDGRIHFELPVAVSGRLDPHVLRGRLNGGGPVLQLRSGDGSVTLGVSD